MRHLGYKSGMWNVVAAENMVYIPLWDDQENGYPGSRLQLYPTSPTLWQLVTFMRGRIKMMNDSMTGDL